MSFKEISKTHKAIGAAKTKSVRKGIFGTYWFQVLSGC
jgi:hypothetical protein